MRAIGGAAVVNRLACFYLDKCGAWITAASRQIASQLCSYSGVAPSVQRFFGFKYLVKP